MRVVGVNFSGTMNEKFILLQTWKPHASSVTAMSINERETILVSGSMERTIFIHQIMPQEPYVKFVPIGFVETPSAPTAFNWKPNMVNYRIC